MKEGYRVQMDSDVGNAINVFNEDGPYIRFVCMYDGLYCINLDNSGGCVNYLTTASEQKDHFSDVDNKRAELARYIQECLCLPSDKDLAGAIDTGGIKLCGIDWRHIKIANINTWVCQGCHGRENRPANKQDAKRQWTNNTHSTKHTREVLLNMII